jgi:shikimate kinase
MNARNTKRHLFLTGYRGTGKSAVGAVLAQRLGRSLIDLDLIIEANAGQTIRQIFAAGGESLFRQLESEALGNVVLADPAVISLGGGAILSEANCQLIKQSGDCIWLTATPETIATRIAADTATADNRPPLTTLSALAEIRCLLEQRYQRYESVADYTISTEAASIESVAAQALQWITAGNRDS